MIGRIARRLALLTLAAALGGVAGVPLAGRAAPVAAASGGGCTRGSSGYPDANYAYSACISLAFAYGFDPPLLFPDAYVTFTAQYPGLWTDCHVYIYTVDETARRDISTHIYDCLADARNDGINVRYGGVYVVDEVRGIWGHAYDNRFIVTGTYRGRRVVGAQLSPTQHT